MAKIAAKVKKPASKQKKEMSFPLGKENFIIIGIGIIVLIIGYIFLASGTVNGFGPMVIAPVLLVLGYCVIIPYGILKKPRSEKPAVESEVTEDFAVSSQASQQTSSVSSNIKTK